MTQEEKKEIVKISKSFANGFKSTIGSINGSGWLIVDPLSAYLNAIGYENKPFQLPEKEGERPQILFLEFKDGSKLVPAGGDLKKRFPEAKNWMWL